MMRSLYSGVTGLSTHQKKMDVIANNIANANTVGFKASRVIFQDIYSQTVASASGATTNMGGINPQQIGLGVQTATIDVLDAEAASQYTGNPLDLAIEGDGYFVIQNGSKIIYTRAGNFYTDEENNLVDSNGNYVLGYALDGDGNLVETPAKITISPDYYDVSIDASGQVIGLDKTTKDITVLGQIILATFANPSGLEKTGENAYRVTANSGDPVYSAPGQDGAGKLNSGSLEMSNVDLTAQFSDMIVTQRGFQANSRIITTTDEMLEELVNMVR